jgi:hypothetical protein
MLKKIVLAASAAAVVLGAGTAALAASGGSSPGTSADPGSSAAGGAATSPSAKAPASTAPSAPDKPTAPSRAQGQRKGQRAVLRPLKRALHAQWVTRDRTNATAFVTHDAIRGAVTAVSASSITVKAADGVSQTYAITGTTKVHLRKGQPGNGNRGGAPGTVSDVHTGDKVAVAGTGTTSLTAQHILDGTE